MEIIAGRAPELVEIPIGKARAVPGTLALPAHPAGVVLFAHGSGSSRLSSRNRAVADRLFDANVGWLLFDLLTDAESRSRDNVFDIPLLAERLRRATDWAAGYRATGELAPGYFGASTGAAAALVAAARDPRIRAVVCRGGRPDLAGDLLRQVTAPTLLIVGGADSGVLEEKNVSCCYARSDKYWVTDLAGVAWESFHSLGTVPFYNGQTQDAEKGACCTPGTELWLHP